MGKPAGINIAGSTMMHVAAIHGLQYPDKPCRTDTGLPDKPRCWVIHFADESERSALVVYENFPHVIHCVLSQGPGRFVPV